MWKECSKLHYYVEKDRLFEINDVLWFWVLSARSARSARDIWVSSVPIVCVLLRVILPQIAQRNAVEEMNQLGNESTTLYTVFSFSEFS